MNPEDLAARLRDIRDIDPVSAWPPGPGWWVIALLVIAVTVVLLRFRPQWPKFKRRSRSSWQRPAVRELGRLSLRVGTEDPKVIAGELAELLRQIAIARCGREACAGLVGDAWLHWLQDNDPNGFDWVQRGRVIAFSIYAPTLPPGATSELRTLITAAKAWTDTEHAECKNPQMVAANV